MRLAALCFHFGLCANSDGFDANYAYYAYFCGFDAPFLRPLRPFFWFFLWRK